jgi:hypothetical protein
MKGSNSLMEWLVKLIFFLMLLPFFISFAFQVFSAVFQVMLAFFIAILPWVIGIAVLIGLVAGASAGLIIRGRVPRGNREYLPPGEAPPVKRPRGPGRDDND